MDVVNTALDVYNEVPTWNCYEQEESNWLIKPQHAWLGVYPEPAIVPRYTVHERAFVFQLYFFFCCMSKVFSLFLSLFGLFSFDIYVLTFCYVFFFPLGMDN